MRKFFPCILAVLFLLASATAALSQETTKMSGRHVWHTVETMSHEIDEGHAIRCYKDKGVGFFEETDEAYTITGLYCLYFLGGNVLGGGVASFQSHQDAFQVEFHLDTSHDKRIFRYLHGTGKFEGVTGEGTFDSHDVEEGMGYTDWGGEYTIVQE